MLEDSAYLTGIRMYGSNYKQFLDYECNELGEWSSPLIITDYERLVGVIGNFGPNDNIESLGFIVAKNTD